MKIYLIGFMGAGKSVVGKRLARRLGLNFTDLDIEIESKEGKTIAEIFEQEGEDRFRELESQYLRQIPKGSVEIIAAGGGTPCFHNNMEYMNENGVTIYLEVSVKKLSVRLKSEVGHRPLLAKKSEDELKSFIASKLKERKAFYQQSQFVCHADAPIDDLEESLWDYFQRFVTVSK